MANDPRPRHGRHAADLPRRFASAAGATPALSALTLRLVLAVFGLLLCAAAAVAFAAAGLPTALVVAAAVLAAIAAVDIVVIAVRKRRGEPG